MVPATGDLATLGLSRGATLGTSMAVSLGGWVFGGSQEASSPGLAPPDAAASSSDAWWRVPPLPASRTKFPASYGQVTGGGGVGGEGAAGPQNIPHPQPFSTALRIKTEDKFNST